MKNNNIIFFISTRWFGALRITEILREKLKNSKYKIHIFGQSDNLFTQFDTKEVCLHTLNIKSSYFDFYSDFKDIIKIVYFIIKLKPVAIHAMNPKPIFISFFSILFFPRIKFFSSQTGLGKLFEKNKFLIPLITNLLKIINRRCSAVFFFNRNDFQMFEKQDVIKKEKIVFVGPYVNIEKFSLKRDRLENNFTQVVCISRLLKQKGVIEFIEVAKKYKLSGNKIKVNFLLIGEIETKHEDRIDAKYILNAENSNYIKRIDKTNNIKSYLHQSDILFLHSYREGAPSVIIEASAAEMPTVGSDAVGVRDLIIDSETGYITEVKNIDLAYKAILKLVNDRNLIIKLGKNAYNKIARPVDINASTQKQIQEYNKAGILVSK